MRIIDRGLLAEAEPGTDRQSCAFPGVCALPGGRWLCSYRAAPTKAEARGQHVRVTWSDDRGQTSAPPIAPFPGMSLNGRPGLIRAAGFTALGGEDVLATLLWVDHGEPDLPYFNEETEGLLDSRLLISRSADGGETWTEPRFITTPPFDCPTPITGPTLLLSDGTWACQYELNKHYYEPEPWQHASVLSFSQDEGRTWPEHSVVTLDPTRRVFYWDQRPSVLSDGTVLDLFWTYDNEAAAYLNIHGRASSDGGRTWGELWDTGVPGQPAQPVSLSGGRVAMVYVDRTGTPAITARISSDGGRTFPAETQVQLSEDNLSTQTVRKHRMQDAWAEMQRFSLGLPATAVLGDEEFLTVYYAGPETDVTDIHWVRVSA